MIKTAIHCLKCGDVIISRAQHDFHYCSCDSVAIDGGDSYMRCLYKEGAKFKMATIDIPYTSKQLYDDWNWRKDKLGSFKLEEIKIVPDETT